MIYEHLLNTSIQAALSSIEIYNKPDFRYREQAFTILITNAWELLFKAKILKDNFDKVESIYATDNHGNYKTNRMGNPLTIEITRAMSICEVDINVANNIEHLIGIRDTAVHFYHSIALDYIVYVLGVAALKNFQKLVSDWFGRSLLEYNFYILPLGFAYNFQTLSLLDFEKEPETIANLIKSVSTNQEKTDISNSFHFVCEVKTQLISAKKFTETPDLKSSVDNDGNESSVIVERLQRLTDKYPLSYKQVWEKVKAARPSVKQNHFNSLIKELKIKGDTRYSSYNFMSKAHRDRYEKENILPSGITCIYNEDAVRLLVESIEEK